MAELLERQHLETISQELLMDSEGLIKGIGSHILRTSDLHMPFPAEEPVGSRTLDQLLLIKELGRRSRITTQLYDPRGYMVLYDYYPAMGLLTSNSPVQPNGILTRELTEEEIEELFKQYNVSISPWSAVDNVVESAAWLAEQLETVKTQRWLRGKGGLSLPRFSKHALKSTVSYDEHGQLLEPPEEVFIAPIEQLDTAKLLARADVMAERLGGEISAASEDLPQGEDEAWVRNKLIPAIEAEDSEALASLGIALPPMLYHVVNTMLHGLRPVEVSLVLPQQTIGEGDAGYSELDKSEITSMAEAANLIKNIHPNPGTVRILSYLNDLSHGTLPYWDDDASGKYAEDVLDLLMQHGVYDASNPQDFRRGSNFATQVDLLLKHLGQSDRGAVFSIAGQTYFLPNDVVRYGDREEGYETGAILMKYGAGFPSDVALQSLALHDEMIEDPLRLILTNPGRSRDYHYIRPHQQDPDHLLQLLEIDEELNPVKAKLAIAYAFLHELEKAKQHITRYASTEAFNAVKYFDHNFGKDVDVLMIEDMKIITALTDLLITLYKPGSVHGKVLDIGAGSNPYLSQLVEPFSPQGVLAIDPAPEARDFLEGRNQGRLPSNIASYIDGISEIVRSKGGQWLYDNCEQKLRGRIQVANGSIYSLPEQAYPIIMEGFVAASITKDPGLYMEAIRSKAKALRSQHGSLSIGLEMLERQEWHTGTDQNGQPIRFPSVYVTPDFIKRSHIQAGLECVVIRIGAGEEGDASGGLAQERGQKYAGMAIVISWPKNMSPPSIVTALGRLRRQGFDIID